SVEFDELKRLSAERRLMGRSGLNVGYERDSASRPAAELDQRIMAGEVRSFANAARDAGSEHMEIALFAGEGGQNGLAVEGVVGGIVREGKTRGERGAKFALNAVGALVTGLATYAEKGIPHRRGGGPVFSLRTFRLRGRRRDQGRSQKRRRQRE